MALFTDSPAFGLEDMAAHETGILDTASTEGIDLIQKISLAIEEVGIELLASLSRQAGAESAGIALGSVVVTSPLRLWQIFHTLEVVYRDAYHSQLNDRYKGKGQEYRDLSRWAAGKLTEIGLGLAADPIPQADAPQLSSQFGGLADGRYFACVAWVNAGGQEGVSGALASIDLASSKTFAVTPVNRPGNAAGWNVYAGVSPLDLFRQNDTVLAADATWAAPDALGVSGPRPGTGQEPSFLKQVARVTLRG